MTRPTTFVITDELHLHTAEQVRRLAALAADHDERLARRAILERFPRSGPWLVEHPRALGLLFRLRPSLRPTLVYVTGTTAAVEARA